MISSNRCSYYILFLVLVFFMLSCDNEDVPNFLELYLETPIDENGYYLVDYPDEEDDSYIFIKYRSLPLTRVFWTSPDSFTVYHMGFPVTEPIINYSTYTSQNSTGQQGIYLYQNFIGDTLTVIGYISDDLYDSLQFIVH